MNKMQTIDGKELPRSTIMSRCQQFLADLSFKKHLIISIIVRTVLIAYGQHHDTVSEVPYTDIDYKVVTDGARQVLEGKSPFDRHTYRYSPILAYMQIPNILMHGVIGKVIYSIFDILVAVLIYEFIRMELRYQCRKAIESLLQKFGKRTSRNYNDTDERNRPEKIARMSACLWLYNPLTAIVSTRGNGDSFSCFFVILTLYLLAKADDTRNGKNGLIFLAGLIHGFSIHLRLYPVIFSLAYFLSLSEKLTNSLRTFLKQILFPSIQQIFLIAGTLISFITICGFFYHLYGFRYLYEAYLYHFVRKDVRHNFSLYFLMQYLSMGTAENSTFMEKALTIGPQICLIIYISFSFGQFRQTLPFCIFSLAFIVVTYNSVVTSQYFVWYLALLPLCLNNLQSISLSKAIALFSLWMIAQGLWLLPAYLLEFKTWNTFYWIGVQGIIFFIVNNLLLRTLIEHYSFTSFKVNFKKLF